MFSNSECKMPLKKFVLAKESRVDVANRSDNYKLIAATNSGNKIKDSYLHIVGQDALQSSNKWNTDVSDSKVSPVQIKKQKSNTAVDLNINSIMKAVEANDKNKVLEFISANKEFVLNCTDQFQWNTLMNACCAGAKDVVELLLQYNPNLYVTDKKGNTCLSLAQSKGHNHIVKLLENYTNKSGDIFETQSRNNDIVVTESFYCDVCKETISESSRSHFTSTVHLFNSSRKSGVPTSYGIPENNVGFQILLKTGWDREKGLGPEGSGHKFPPKTVLKQDRAGLGAKKYVSRVTHDSQTSMMDRSERQRTLNRRERLRQEIKAKRKDRELRRMLD